MGRVLICALMSASQAGAGRHWASVVPEDLKGYSMPALGALFLIPVYLSTSQSQDLKALNMPDTVAHILSTPEAEAGRLSVSSSLASLVYKVYIVSSTISRILS